jgi:hypothetical protein
MKLSGHPAGMGGVRGAYMYLVGRPKEKRLRGRLISRWEDNIKMVLQEVLLEHSPD